MTWKKELGAFSLSLGKAPNWVGQSNPLEDPAVIQGDLDTLAEWTGKNHTKLSKDKSKVLHIGRNNSLE